MFEFLRRLFGGERDAQAQAVFAGLKVLNAVAEQAETLQVSIDALVEVRDEITERVDELLRKDREAGAFVERFNTLATNLRGLLGA